MDRFSDREPAPDVRQSPVIEALRLFSSGWAEQHKEHRYGTWKPKLWWVLTSQSWIRVPINYFLIEHRDVPVLFDTGLDPAIATDRRYIDSALGRFLFRRIFRLHIGEDDRLDRLLAKDDFDAGASLLRPTGVFFAPALTLFINLGSFSRAAVLLERNRSKLRQIDGEQFVERVPKHYSALSPRHRTLIPLKQIYVPDLPKG